jgi:hypothetical protein
MSGPEQSTRLDRIAEARSAILDRAQEILTPSSSEQRRALSRALRTLQLLEKIVVQKTDAV